MGPMSGLTGLNILVTGDMIRPADTGRRFMLMAMSMRGTGRRTRQMDRVSIERQMGLSIGDFGRTIFLMEKESRYLGIMMLFLRGYFIGERNRDWGVLSSQMEVLSRVTLGIIISRGRGLLNGPMGRSILEVGS